MANDVQPEIGAIEWLNCPVTEDGSGYILVSPTGAKIKLSDQDRKYIVRCADKLAKIESMARRHNHPGCNTGAQTLAAAIVRIIEEK